ncbi:MAG: MmgE/PrpD family protein [Betaproteobacteria bacterium]|nr:MmgE/PrpD family protein [Betaproteobacteria bacterium]
MGATTAHLVDFALQTEFASVPANTVHECKRRLIDTFVCAVGAYDEPISQMARATARRCTGSPFASVWGGTTRQCPKRQRLPTG